MAGYYIRRGESVIGPVDAAKLKEAVQTGKLLPTDKLATDAAGPWTEVGRTKLFAKEPSPKEEHPPLAPRSTAEHPPLAPRTAQEHPPLAPTPAVETQPPSKLTTVVQTANIFVATVGRGTLAAWVAISTSLSASAKRRHELKLAKIQAKATADSLRLAEIQAQGLPAQPQQVAAPAQTPAPAVNIMFAPQMTQTTAVKVINKGGTKSSGCSGCALLLLLIIAGLVIAAIISSNSPTTTP